jgi:hypothetical protein
VTCFKAFACSNTGSPQKPSVMVVGVPNLDSVSVVANSNGSGPAVW